MARRAPIAARVPPWALLLCLGGLPAAPALAQGPPTAFWDFSLHVAESWYSNRDLTTASPSVSNTRAGGGIAYTRNSPLSQFSLSADAAYSFDNQQQGRNRVNYSGGLSWNKRLGPRTSLQFREAVSQSYSQTAPILAEVGLVYPYTLIRTNSTSLSLSQQLSTRTSLSLGGRYQWVDFPDAALSSAYFGQISGQQASGTVDLAQVVSEFDQLGLGYAYRWSDTRGPVFHDNSLSASWTRRLGKTTSASVSLGGSYWTAPVLGLSQYVLIASSSLRGQVGRTTFNAGYSRAPQQAFGIGSERIADVLSLSLSRTLTRSLSVSGRGIRTFGRDLVDPSFKFDTQALSLALQYRPTPQLSFGGGYGWTRVALNGVVLDSHSLDVTASYGWRWQ